MPEKRVIVRDEFGNRVGRVRHCTNLDRWDGYQWCDGLQHMHMGITKMRDGRMVLIETNMNEIQSKQYSARVISDEEAVRIIAEKGHVGLFKQKKYKHLQPLYELIGGK